MLHKHKFLLRVVALRIFVLFLFIFSLDKKVISPVCNKQYYLLQKCASVYVQYVPCSIFLTRLLQNRFHCFVNENVR
jgi:hypothetical protein